jgi:protein phosphatase
MKVGYKSDVGKVRDNNEDSLFVDERQGLFIVADGMGGHQGGEVASRMAVEIVRDFLNDKILSSDKKEDFYKLLMEAIFAANESVRLKAEGDINLKGMGTTIVIALCRNDNLYISHVGDSRAYLIREGNIKQLTEDHSVVAQMVKAGMMTDEEARRHHLKHILSQALGTSAYLAPSFQMLNMEEGDYILLCTDGLTDMLNDQEILSSILACNGEPEKGCELLVNEANRKGGKDNITVILLYKN